MAEVKSVRTGLNFARTYPFYIKLPKADQAYFFSITISASKKLNLKTGMSVDLVSLDRLAEGIFKSQKSQKTSAVEMMADIVNQVQVGLKKIQTKLVSVKFSECRGSAYLFTGRQMYFIRQDYASDDVGDLFQVTSYFNKKNVMTRMDLKNLKLNTQEQIIF